MIEPLDSDKLSTFRTHHHFENYAEFSTIEEFKDCVAWAKDKNVDFYILGNGSNTIFAKTKVRSLVLRNKLKKDLTTLGDETHVKASSSLPISVILKHCQDRNLDCFYYLASVPATLGGALAMNAGRGRIYNQTIFDFVETVTYFDGNEVITLRRDEIELSYRKTMFTGLNNSLILEATFNFPELPERQPDAAEDAAADGASPAEDGSDKKKKAVDRKSLPISQRIAYSKENQDHSAPNCGSVFKEAKMGILGRIQGTRLGSAQYSPKTINWLLSHGTSPRPMIWLIRYAKAVHLLFGRRAVLELIVVK
ncbi:FAD-binding protein [Algisphaera agarilytica]|uniref:UDP-N-acetylenolpyruvoylglucosamine reductase n=1 Tax=Algisphaera agarilytica TaxID=1385975 RepID=A0A7X0H802_9BACT|nr:FAD-binding protein [Algisphaera agarilytica]MBB6430783.1 UDP-N-acetylmuramate dehydrogenase [Algisphaera agarilytica]